VIESLDFAIGSPRDVSRRREVCMEERNSEQFSPKTRLTPLSGSVHAEFVRCGKSGCRCEHGNPHGPYFRRFWREAGRTRSRYIRLVDVPAVAAACDRHAEIHTSRRAFKRMLRDFSRLSDEVMACLEAWQAPASAP
jgi:hypothetical protein